MLSFQTMNMNMSVDVHTHTDMCVYTYSYNIFYQVKNKKTKPQTKNNKQTTPPHHILAMVARHSHVYIVETLRQLHA